MTESAYFWDQEIIANIAHAPTIQIKQLAQIAGISVNDIFQYGDISRVDLRGQDLSGVDLTKVDLSTSLYDATTIIDDQRALRGGQEALLLAVENAINNARDLPKTKELSARLRGLLLQSLRAIFFIGSKEDFGRAFSAPSDADIPFENARVSGGYYKRDSLVINSNPNRPALQTFLDFVESTTPSLMRDLNSSRIQSAQLELPLQDENTPTPAKIPESVNLNRIIQQFKKHEKVGAIWLTIDTDLSDDDIKNIQQDIAKILRLGIKLNFVFLCPDLKFLHSVWRKSMIIDSEVSEFRTDYFRNQGIEGYLRSICASIPNTLKYTFPATSLLNSQSYDWLSAKDVVRLATKIAILKSRKLPIAIGIRHVRDATQSIIQR